MTLTSKDRANPYVGPRSFVKGETLYGRDQEVNDLVNLLVAERIVLLYSPSGAGKTSLIQAALIEKLEKEEGFRVLPIMRPGLEPSPEAPADANRYLLSVLHCLEEGLPPEQKTHLVDADLARLTFAAYLERLGPGPEESGNEVLIFDQFEEILTLDPTDEAAKEIFFAQVGEVLRPKHRWALFAMREEYVAGLEPYLRAIPTRLSSTFRLELLGLDPAQQAIKEPAERVQVTFTDDAANKLVADLSIVYVQRQDGNPEPHTGLYVEPVQLQVVCQRLWEAHPGDKLEINEEEHLKDIGDVSKALAGFYAEQVAVVAQETAVPERGIREWVQNHLITKYGFRGQALQEPGQTQGLDNRAIRGLVKAHLVREDRRGGRTWFELAHDRLIEPVRENNEAWFQAHLNTLQLQANLWYKQDRPDGLLLSGQALVAAEQWAEANDPQLQDYERDFLADCRTARTRLERERRNARVFKGLFAVAAALAIGIIIFWILTVQQSRLNMAGQWASSAFASLYFDPERSILLALKAVEEVNAVKEVPLAGWLVPKTAKRVLQVAENALHRAMSISRVELNLVDPLVKTAHKDKVFRVLFSPDGTRLATVSLDKTVKVWDAASGKMLHSLEHKEKVSWASFNKNGSQLATACADKTAKIWDVTNGKILHTLNHDKEIFRVDFNKQGTCLATTSNDDTVKLWNADSWKPLLPPLKHPLIVALAFSPDGRFLATAGFGGQVKIWEVASGNDLGTIKHGEYLSRVSFSPGGTLLVTWGQNNIGKIWDISLEKFSPEKPLSWIEDSGIKDMDDAVTVSPDNKLLATANINNFAVEVRDISTGQLQAILPGHTNSVFKLVFLSKGEFPGRFLVTCSADGTAKVWDTLFSKELFTLAGHLMPLDDIAVSPDEKHLATVCWDGQAKVWDIRVDHPSGVSTLAFDEKGTRLATASFDGTAGVWDTATKEELFPLEAQGGCINKIAFSPNWNKLVTAGNDKTVRFYNATTGEMLDAILTGLRGENVAFSPTGKLLALQLRAAHSFNSTIFLLDLASPAKKEEPIFKELKGYEFKSLAFSPNEKQMATGLDNGKILLWDLEAKNEEKPKELPDQNGPVMSVAYSPNGDYLASGGLDRTVKLWDTKSWEVRTFEPFDSAVASVAFSRDGTKLVAASWDRTARVFSIGPDQGAQGKKTKDINKAIHVFTHSTALNDVAFSPDGNKLAVACIDGWHIYSLDLKEAVTQAKKKVTRELTPEECQRFGITRASSP